MTNPTPIPDLSGQPLSDAVAREVMGWTHKERPGDSWGNGMWYEGDSHKWWWDGNGDPLEGYGVRLFDPHTDPVACGFVKAKLRGMEGVFKIDIKWEAILPGHHPWSASICIRGRGWEIAFGRSECEAVCRAAVMAGREVRGG